MSTFKDIRRVFGGMNTDDNERDVPQGDYIDALNMTSGVSASGIRTNVLGNTLVNYTLPSGDNTCIGALRDIQRNAVIYFVYNTLGNHSILHYLCSTNTIEEILAPSATIPFDTSFLGFTLDGKIHSANVIDNILTWTDNVNPPRKINIKRAKDFMQQLPPSAVNTPYSNLLATGTLEEQIEFIDFIKRPDITEPIIELGYDSTRLTNFIRNKMIQTRYRYIYDDNEKSVWTTGSKVSLPEGQENINGPYTTTTDNNYLDVFYDSGHPTVKAIEICFRFGNTGTWMKIDEPIQKYDNDNQQILPDFTTLTFRFYNDRVLIPLSDDESLKNYDSVPLLSKTQELIDGNRQVLCNNLEGYDNPDIDVSIAYQNEQLNIGDGEIDDIIIYQNGFISYLSLPLDIGNIAANQVLSFTVHTLYGYTPVTYTISETDLLNYPYSLRSGIFNYLKNNFQTSGSGFTVQTVGIFNYLGVDYVAVGADTTAAPQTDALSALTVYTPTTKYTNWKKGAYHKFGLVYYDYADRDGGVVTSDAMQIYNPYLPELYGVPATAVLDDFIYRTLFNVTINHRPPIWAKRYQIVYSTNNLRKYTQFLVKGTIGTDAFGNFTIDCSYIQDYVSNRVVQTSVDFQFEAGDRLRFIANNENYCPTYVETEVLGYDTSTKTMTVRPFTLGDVTGNMATPSTDKCQVELFAYEGETENQIYYEIGENYAIIDYGTVNASHAGNLQNQNSTLTQPAIIKLANGDSYIYKRWFPTGGSTYQQMNVESENFSDYYASKNIDISRIQIVTNSSQKRYEQSIRYGGRYFPNTNTNDLCSFDGDAFDNLDTRYGAINKVITIGYVLKALQTKKVTSIYINRNMIFNADGSPQLIQTDQVLSDRQPSETDFGCDNPESVCKDERQMFFFDVNNGAFVQDSANGLFPISDNKMATYFRRKAQAINDSQDTIYVYSSVDNYLSTVNVSFVNQTDEESTINDTILYNTDNNRWHSRQSYRPDYVCSNALVFVSFSNGALYVHNDNLTRNNFYGVQYDTTITVVSNINPQQVKVFDSVWVQANKVFGSPNIGDINILPSANYPNGMASRLIAAKFRAKESVFYADYMRDANTPNIVSQAVALQDGRKLRGQALLHKLTNSDTTEVVLYEIIINSTYSEIS